MKYHFTRRACYFSYFAMAGVFVLPPMLFLTFREQFGISYTLLGTLVLVNFCTQFAVDLVFTFFSRHFDLRKVVRTMPLLTSMGLVLYALIPTFLPQYAYLGLVAGTVVFSVSAGLSEVLLSPTVAALPSEDPGRDMSKLHSLYAWGVLTAVLVGTTFLKLFGVENWKWLILLWAALPLIPFVLFCMAPFPKLELSHSAGSGTGRSFRIGLFVACIFLGSAAENVMTNWISGYIETSLHIPKALGDLLGMAVFAALLGLARTVYAKRGKNISRVLLLSMAGAFVCYIIAGLSPGPVPALIACAFTGLCTSMLWPGTLIWMEEEFPHAGAAVYALMAAGGDFGASVAPQLMGIVVDTVSKSSWAAALESTLALSPEQLGMKVGMLTAAIFPLLGTVLVIGMRKRFSHKSNS